MKNIDWDERRYQIILNLTKNVTISDRSGVPYREIESMADELISYMKEKANGCNDFDNKVSLMIKVAKEVPEAIRKEAHINWCSYTPEYERGLYDATNKIISIIEEIKGKEDEKV